MEKMVVMGNEIKEDKKLLLSVKEVSDILGISQKSVRNFSYEMNMQVRIGKRVLIHRKKLEKWIDRQVLYKSTSKF